MVAICPPKRQPSQRVLTRHSINLITVVIALHCHETRLKALQCLHQILISPTSAVVEVQLVQPVHLHTRRRDHHPAILTTQAARQPASTSGNMARKDWAACLSRDSMSISTLCQDFTIWSARIFQALDGENQTSTSGTTIGHLSTNQAKDFNMWTH
ncbi:hypothetical protein VFPPC_18531 [Pochonia chlamydosporia 170]|uniref:Uncharacterized protein n=1 Tax=Pochonia chlamydosporia 170 TaxID=1380566 RepID=A0A219AP63_METCM|nr:hypothetical protein VFPPC_18531 [Pochonia chlamydosporia 170]OWT42342.1 hypothetical protein VFPPC_18531 [Pochonia chlamydosporia 170]